MFTFIIEEIIVLIQILENISEKSFRYFDIIKTVL